MRYSFPSKTMKKILLSLFVLATATGAANAQIEIGLKISPSINYLRADGPSNNFKSEGSQLGFGGGLLVDYFFGENYAFSTGLFLTGKGGSYSYQHQDLSTSSGLSAGSGMTYKLSTQYLEVPITLKLFTNEIAPDIRLYFQVGGSLAVPVGASINSNKNFKDLDSDTNFQQTTALSHVFFFDANAVGGLGIEYQLGRSTKVLAGFSYHRGLINLDHYYTDKRQPNISDVTFKNNVFALDLGLKF